MISVFVGGCVVGLVTFSRVFSYLFKKYNDVVISVLVGFLLGSLFKIWPFYKVLEYNASNEPIYTNPVLPTSSQQGDLMYFIIFSIIGFASMWLAKKKILSESGVNVVDSPANIGLEVKKKEKKSCH